MSVASYTVSGHVVHLQLNRPEKLNAIDDEMFESLIELTGRLGAQPSLRAVVISGRGGGFCAGLDFSVFQSFAAEADSGERPFADPDDATGGSGRRRPGRGQRIVQNLRSVPVPVIAAVHGAAIGGGLQLALAADMRLVAHDAKLALRELDFGITPDMGGTQLLARLVGPDRALDMTLTGRIVSGDEAVAIGLATRVCADPVADALALAAQIATRSPTAARHVVSLVRRAGTVTVEEGMRAELEVMARNIGSPNQVEATRAYFEHRTGHFVDGD